MINWNNIHIAIDKQAKIQLDRYFEALQKILVEQHLSESDIFNDLENHIIDYVTINRLKSVTFQDALSIIGELGPPDEYKDFSTLPSISDEINKKEKGRVNQSFVTSNKVKCSNCGCLNESDSVYCIQCGSLIKNENKIQKRNNPITYVFNKNPEYFFGILSFFLLELFILNIEFETALSLLILNEFILIPGIFLYRIIKTEFTRSELYSFLLTYLLKIVTIITLIVLYPDSMIYSNLILSVFIFMIYPIILTKLLFFTKYSGLFNFDNKLNYISKLGYVLITISLVGSIFIFGVLTFNIVFFFLFFVLVLYVLFDFTVLSKNDIQTKKAFSQSFLPYPAYFFSIFSIILFACFFIGITINFSHLDYIIEFFIINEIVIIPIFFVYELLIKDSNKFNFFCFFFSCIIKFTSLLLIILILNFNLLGMVSDTVNNIILLMIPIVLTKMLFLSNYTIKLQKQFDLKSTRSDLIKYCIVEGGILISILYFQEYSNSALLNIIAFFFLLVALGLYFIQDFQVESIFNFAKKRNQLILK